MVLANGNAGCNVQDASRAIDAFAFGPPPYAVLPVH